VTENTRVKVKVCLVGECAVGKTSLIRRYVLDQFDDKYIATMGAKISKKEMLVPSPNNGGPVQVDMTIWDIMGEKSFRELVRDAFFYGTKGVIAVCDITAPESLSELDFWVDDIFDLVGEIPVIYSANKSDLRDEYDRVVDEFELRQATKAFNAPFYFTSAKTGENVEETFAILGDMIVKRVMNRDSQPSA
jgi:small GTP-binding protein